LFKKVRKRLNYRWLVQAYDFQIAGMWSKCDNYCENNCRILAGL